MSVGVNNSDQVNLTYTFQIDLTTGQKQLNEINERLNCVKKRSVASHGKNDSN